MRCDARAKRKGLNATCAKNIFVDILYPHAPFLVGAEKCLVCTINSSYVRLREVVGTASVSFWMLWPGTTTTARYGVIEFKMKMMQSIQ